MTGEFQKVRQAGRTLAGMGDARRRDVMLRLADAVDRECASLLKANASDLARMDAASPLYDRLMLTEGWVADIAAGIRHVAGLPSPLGKVTHDRVLGNGLHIRRISRGIHHRKGHPS